MMVLYKLKVLKQTQRFTFATFARETQIFIKSMRLGEYF